MTSTVSKWPSWQTLPTGFCTWILDSLMPRWKEAAQPFLPLQTSNDREEGANTSRVKAVNDTTWAPELLTNSGGGWPASQASHY